MIIREFISSAPRLLILILVGSILSQVGFTQALPAKKIICCSVGLICFPYPDAANSGIPIGKFGTLAELSYGKNIAFTDGVKTAFSIPVGAPLDGLIPTIYPNNQSISVTIEYPYYVEGPIALSPSSELYTAVDLWVTPGQTFYITVSAAPSSTADSAPGAPK